ncbi:MAG: hypothetical protein ACR2IP_06780 [Solirubrobacteraceae bacterium]
MRTARDGARGLLAALRVQGGTVAELLDDQAAELLDEPAAPGPAQVAASGPRASGSEAEYELLVEMILEGSRLHYGTPLVVRTADSDLALLLGDQLYALGLARLAAIGDLDAIGELADVISLIAQAHAAGDPDLAAAVWQAGGTAVGWGYSEEHERAKAAARAGEPGAVTALRRTAQRGEGRVGAAEGGAAELRGAARGDGL